MSSQTGSPKMALCSLAGNARSPVHAEPTHFHDSRRAQQARETQNFPLLTERSTCILISDTDMSKPNDLVQGTLDLLLLKILALEPLHGWAISLRLKSISGDVLQVSEGS